VSRGRGISDNSAIMAAQVLLDKWAARGLNAAVLALIRTQVFDKAHRRRDARPEARDLSRPALPLSLLPWRTNA
jgi:hypothetical protein